MSAPRGPPRKARQSGYALWVGNLPFSACIIALKDHFSRDAWHDIESLCLLSSSSCAFVNYRSEEAVLAAHQRFNGSRFGPVRLLCRVRNGKEQKPSSRGSPIACPPGLQQPTEGGAVQEIADDLAEMTITPESSSVRDAASPVQTLATPQKAGDRYFIVKSLTLQDLQVSLKNGLWETQPHNRIILDEAFDSADNVYLVFSVNKSGEYFGYARMVSRSFEQDEAATNSSTETGARVEPEVDHNAGLIIVPTAATETAPSGHIVEDIVRGTIFWEADYEEPATSSDSLRQSVSSESSAATTHSGEKSPTDSANGIPTIISSSSNSNSNNNNNKAFDEKSPSRRFQVEWRSFQCVPFRRTKGMRNSWNDNKEVKVARDGTELETEVGKQLVALFHGPNGAGSAAAVTAAVAVTAAAASSSVAAVAPIPNVVGGGGVEIVQKHRSVSS
ncbi:uncharacterized protein K489DRAFT_327218 [Dissoconium aciculare CBS 342.82]|uniref:YTH domain-containing protein n=1 Tax=Dissoconium aciculare CBS 342.82 TaxID=1314786 RepID=A0A6J3LSW5_9PEZI|nr:uncharacterized protein K489DRAFT_327218 [Dissoconium aciculare CBS 342.82]KAF1818723.1 hypothetical protein K489DRAFT_327218 [Dissoconium aciculare CBS 342.82]